MKAANASVEGLWITSMVERHLQKMRDNPGLSPLLIVNTVASSDVARHALASLFKEFCQDGNYVLYATKAAFEKRASPTAVNLSGYDKWDGRDTSLPRGADGKHPKKRGYKLDTSILAKRFGLAE